MAIGFTVTNITDKKVIPDKTLTRQQTPRVRIPVSYTHLTLPTKA